MFGRAMRQEFLLNPDFTLLNHGSYGKPVILSSFCREMITDGVASGRSGGSVIISMSF